MSDKEVEPMPTQDAGILSWVGSRAIQSFQPTPRPWRAAVVFFVVSGVLLTLYWLAGPYPITLFPQDTIHVLAHGDCLSQGLVPYSDYFTMYPFLPFAFSSLGISLFGISLKAIVFTQILCAGLFGSLLFLACSTRLCGFWAVACGLFAELLLLTATPLGYKSWRQFSYAMSYNSLGFVLLAVLFVVVLIPREKDTIRRLLIDAALAGITLALLFLAKITFFVVGAGVFLAAQVIWASRYALVRTVVSTLVACVAAVLLYASVNASVLAYLAYIRSLPTEGIPILMSFRFLQYSRTLSLFLLSCVIAIHLLSVSCGWKITLRIVILAAVAAGAIIMATATCNQDQEVLPFLGLVPLSMAVLWVRRASPEHTVKGNALAAVLALVILVLIGTDAKDSAMSLAFCRLRPRAMTPQGREVSKATLDLLAQGQLDPRVDPEIFRQLPASFVDVEIVAPLSLLEKAGSREGDVLFVVRKLDPVTLLTRTRRPKGWNSWWLEYLFQDPKRSPLPVEDFLADTQWILRTPRSAAFWRYLMYHRGDYVRSHFKVVATNQHWQLYERQ